MDKTEYDKKMEELVREHTEKKGKLHVEYALSNSTVKKGDIVTDHIGSIKVDRIKVMPPAFTNCPQCVYIGQVLKKDGTPTKRIQERTVFQSNMENKPNK